MGKPTLKQELDSAKADVAFANNLNKELHKRIDALTVELDEARRAGVEPSISALLQHLQTENDRLQRELDVRYYDECVDAKELSERNNGLIAEVARLTQELMTTEAAIVSLVKRVA